MVDQCGDITAWGESELIALGVSSPYLHVPLDILGAEAEHANHGSLQCDHQKLVRHTQEAQQVDLIISL